MTTLAVFTKNRLNPAYRAARLAADRVAAASGAAAVHFVPEKPDNVEQQIRSLYKKVGGFDFLLMMMQCGFFSHEKTLKNIRMFAQEVMPRLKDLAPCFNIPAMADVAE